MWNSWFQKTIVPAQYFRDPAHHSLYLDKSQFLADLNNERQNEHNSSRDRFRALEKLVLMKFSEDTTVVATETAFFEEVDPCTGAVVSFHETRLYQEDLIGLQEIFLYKRVDFYTVEDVDMRFLAEFMS